MTVFNFDLEIGDHLLTFFVEDNSVSDALYALQTNDSVSTIEARKHDEAPTCHGRDNAIGDEVDKDNTDTDARKKQLAKWSYNERKALIKMCAEEDVMKVVSRAGESFVRPGEKWERIANRMKGLGFNQSVVQVKSQWTNEKKKYRLQKNPPTGKSREEIKYCFESLMDEYMGSDPSVKPKALVASTSFDQTESAQKSAENSLSDPTVGDPRLAAINHHCGTSKGLQGDLYKSARRQTPKEKLVARLGEYQDKTTTILNRMIKQEERRTEMLSESAAYKRQRLDNDKLRLQKEQEAAQEQFEINRRQLDNERLRLENETRIAKQDAENKKLQLENEKLRLENERAAIENQKKAAEKAAEVQDRTIAMMARMLEIMQQSNAPQ